jgi:hypothetical protein
LETEPEFSWLLLLGLAIERGDDLAGVEVLEREHRHLREAELGLGAGDDAPVRFRVDAAAQHRRDFHLDLGLTVRNKHAVGVAFLALRDARRVGRGHAFQRLLDPVKRDVDLPKRR